ncbi:nucleopolyhedrovirus P10 family protein [Streptomyces nigra]|uniref:nucleopolyhedrovirus P10 family protein n=1 Tax=Streptomyces nigra TaxID=1827580 RepID=UPI000D52A480|nr:nucleopolyhedrovirus P10 family protein [Streptomyces nigra]AWE49558.1 nucleopolyhedrovirus P10 family protein [Streptomyces nigra]
MTTADRLQRAVRRQTGLGRLLPLGGARDGAWIFERAAEAVLRRAAEPVRGARLGALRIGPAGPGGTAEPVVPPPPSALPPGPLRITAECAAAGAEPLPVTADRLRAALSAASDHLGLTVTEVDLRVTALFDEDGGDKGPASARASEPVPPARPANPDEERVTAVALAVPGVTGLTGALGRSVHIETRQNGTALPHRHVRVELAVAADHRAVEVAREVRERVGRALADRPTVAVVVTSAG